VKKEIQGVLFFLGLQNVIFLIILWLGYNTAAGQAIMTVLTCIAAYIYLEHEDNIKERLEKIHTGNGNKV
jgi:ABC-type protease/lipase transport system fused ATPase/permease subunit